MKRIKKFIGKWWRGLKYDPSDPEYYEQIKIAAIGGGSGLSNLLEGIKHISQNITAIVTVTDNGQSSGKIRKEFGFLPPGDIRKCLAALSKRNGTLREIFEYRFTGDKETEGLSGHAFGNIWLAALTQYFGSFEKAIEESGNLLDIIGKVYPTTLDSVDLACKYKNGKESLGEVSIADVNRPIDKLSLNKKAKGYSKAIKAIESAELIIIGPGSLYTSIIPNFLVSGITEAVKKNTKALKIFICNVSTERGETENLSVDDHINAFLKHAPRTLDMILVNDRLIKESKESHKIGEVNNITTDQDNISRIQIVKRDIINEENPLYHDNRKLAKAVIDCYNDFNNK